MKRCRSVQTRPNANILWGQDANPLATSRAKLMSEHPDLISKTRTLSEDQLTLVVDHIFPDSFNWEEFDSQFCVTISPAEKEAKRQYVFENGITWSFSVDDI